MAPMEQTGEGGSGTRGIFLTVYAVLFVVLGISDCTKALQRIQNPEVGGLVVFGHKFMSIGTNAILGPIFGLILFSYAYGIWRMKRWVLPLSIAYAFYVPVNLVLFWSMRVGPPPSLNFILFYLFVSLSGSIGTAIYLAYHRERLS